MIKIELKQDIVIPSDNSINNSILKANERIAPILENYIKLNHRYKSKTGKLKSASKVDYTNQNIKAYIDNKMVDYGSYIHDGRKGWIADSFIEEAIRANSIIIERILNEEVDKVIL
jgi:hypothetical protein